MGEVVDVPLKVPQETFTDEPSDIGGVNIHDLVIGINTNLKNINKLHVFEALAVVMYHLNDITKLQQHPELFNAFRELQLEKYHIDINSFKSSFKQVSPPDSPPLEEEAPQLNNGSSLFKDTTPESDSVASDVDMDSFVPAIEDLIRTTDLEKSYAVDFDDIKPDLIYYQNPKILDQLGHVGKLFNLVTPPGLSIEQYLERIKNYSSAISVLCYIHAAYLIFRLCVIDDVIKLTECNVHRLILALIRCLTKKLEDFFQKQKTYATVGGVSQKDLFKIEVGFLFLSNFRLNVTEDSLNNFLDTFASLRSFVKEHIDDK